MSDLPKVFQNEIDKDIGNNNKYSYDKNEEINNIRKSGVPVLEKIKNIFNSPNYVYKADVIIEYQGLKQEKRVIGYNKNELITIDDEKISISEIDDIYLK